MSYPVYGRYQVAEPPTALRSLHVHDGAAALKEVDHETPIGVLDQSDLPQQGIHTSRFIPGCKVDAPALGSCTANAVMEAAAHKLGLTAFLAFCKLVIHSSYAEGPKSFADVVGIERAAIAFYYKCTHQTADPSQEWPPTDCGSSGPYLISELLRLGAISGQAIAHGGQNLISLLQSDCVMMGGPWFYSWEEPDAHGFIGGKGRASDIEASINSGVAGGHETTLVAIEKLVLLPTGHVDPHKTIVRIRNHWTKGWGDNGCCRVFLSVLEAFGGQSDYRQLR